MSNVYFGPSSDFIDLATKIFEEQKRKIIGRLPYADVQHIGSTSIPNALTKGDLDLVVRVPKDKFKHARQELKALYGINQPENWSSTFASFKDVKNLGIAFGAQLVIQNSRSDDFVKLRDILLGNHKLLKEFNLMKLRYNNKGMEEYQKEKADFFQKLRKKFL